MAGEHRRVLRHFQELLTPERQWLRHAASQHDGHGPLKPFILELIERSYDFASQVHLQSLIQRLSEEEVRWLASADFEEERRDERRRTLRKHRMKQDYR
jgi:hypothetical protein